MLLQPLDKRAQKNSGFGLVGRLGMAGGAAGQINSGGIVFERNGEFIIPPFEPEEDLITPLLILKARRIIGLDKVEIEIPFRHGR